MPNETDALNAELDAILGELGVGAAEEGTNEAFAALSAELSGTEFADEEGAGLMSMLGVENDPEMEELIFGVIKDRAQKLVRQLVALAKRYRNCPKCILLVAKTVALFKAKKYPQAIATGIKAVNCFRTCAR